jgi:hypothetical protein
MAQELLIKTLNGTHGCHVWEFGTDFFSPVRKTTKAGKYDHT